MDVVFVLTTPSRKELTPQHRVYTWGSHHSFVTAALSQTTPLEIKTTLLEIEITVPVTTIRKTETTTVDHAPDLHVATEDPILMFYYISSFA